MTMLRRRMKKIYHLIRIEWFGFEGRTWTLQGDVRSLCSLDLVDVLYNSLDNESISQWFKIGCIKSSRMS